MYNIQQFQYHNKNNNYQTALKSKYTIAWDKTNEKRIVKGYCGFNSFIEYLDVINKITKGKNRVFFEIIKTRCKAYYDFDKLNITKPALQDFITQFIIHYNLFFKTAITENELIVYIRDNNEHPNVIKSVHLIITGSIVAKRFIKNSIEYFKLVMDNNIVYSLDELIYTKNRLFNLFNNTKLKYLHEDDGSNPRYFKDFKKQSNDPKDYLASYTDDLTEIKPSGYNLLALALVKRNNKLSFNKIKEAFNKLKNNNVNVEQKPREKINVDEPIDIFEYILFNLPVEFYKNSDDWKQLTLLLKKFGLSKQEFNMWNKQSVLNSSWNLDQNETYYNQLDILKCKSGKILFKQIIEKHIYIEIIFTNNASLCKWLIEKTGVDKKTVDSILLNSGATDRKRNCVIQVGDYVYKLGSGFLQKQPEEEPVAGCLVGNYFVEVEYKILATDTQLKNVEVLQNIEDIIPRIDEFNNDGNNSILAVKAKWASGKTHFIIRKIINYSTEHKKRVIMITENNSLNKQIVSQFTSENVKFISHINNSKRDLNPATLSVDEITTQNTNAGTIEEDDIINIVCSTESIQKINFKKTDILILDEYESIINHYESETFKDQHCNKFALFKHAIQTVNKIAMLDADLSNERLELISNIRERSSPQISGRIEIKPIHILTDNFKDYEFNYFIDRDDLFINCKNDIKKGLKLIYSSSSKNYLNGAYKELIKSFPNKVIVLLKAEGIEINTEFKISKNEALNNLEQFIIENKVDVFLHTPSIKTGISINCEYFDKCYAYGHSKSVCSREFIQMLFRARLLKQKSINIATNTTIRKPRAFVNTAHINKYLINPVYLLQTFKLFDEVIDTKNNHIDYQSLIKYDEDYLFLKLININENYNSTTRYTQDFLIRMIYNHGIKINFIDELEIEEEPEEKEEIEPPEIDPSEIVKCRLVTTREYLTNTKLNWREKRKYELFYNTYFIKGITDQLIINEDIYNKLNNEAFYLKYMNSNNINSYHLLKSILNKDINILQNDLTDEIHILKEINNEFTDYERIKGRQIIITKLLTEMKLDLNVFPIKITNAELETIMRNFNFTNFHNELKQYYDNYKIEHKFNFDFTHKDYVKNIKRVITELLGNIDIHIKYVNKNTSGKNDRMRLSFTEFKIASKLYQGRLTETDTRICDDQVKRIKNTFTFNDVKVYPSIKVKHPQQTTSKSYFTTYKVNINKATKALMNNVSDNDDDIKSNRTNTMKELFQELLYKIKPIVITQAKYNEFIKRNYMLLEIEEEQNINEYNKPKNTKIPKNIVKVCNVYEKQDCCKLISKRCEQSQNVIDELQEKIQHIDNCIEKDNLERERVERVEEELQRKLSEKSQRVLDRKRLDTKMFEIFDEGEVDTRNKQAIPFIERMRLEIKQNKEREALDKIQKQSEPNIKPNVNNIITKQEAENKQNIDINTRNEQAIQSIEKMRLKTKLDRERDVLDKMRQNKHWDELKK